MVGITNVTNTTLEQVLGIANSTSIPEFFIRVNHTIYNGWFWFIMLWVLVIILYVAAQKFKDQPLNNAMYACGVATVLSFVLRGVIMVIDGSTLGLLTDHQLWVFPIITIVLATIIWSIKE